MLRAGFESSRETGRSLPRAHDLRGPPTARSLQCKPFVAQSPESEDRLVSLGRTGLGGGPAEQQDAERPRARTPYLPKQARQSCRDCEVEGRVLPSASTTSSARSLCADGRLG